MWIKTYEQRVIGVNKAEIWQVWQDVNNWHYWMDDVENAEINGDFKAGNIISCKLKNGPIIDMELTQVQENVVFADLTKFFLAKMHVTHEFIIKDDIVELRNTFKVTGLLGYVWRKLLLEKVYAYDKVQNQNLIKRVLELKNRVH